MTDSPFFNYRSDFDAQAIMHRHAVSDLDSSPEHLTNFLGVKISPRFFPSILDGKEGQIEDIPIPANWHADIAEWASVLRAVELSHDKFTVVELGCGWGCWLNNSGVAARRMGRKVKLIGVEGDVDYISFATQAADDNGFTRDQILLFRGVAAANNGTALFPKQSVAGKNWGLSPTFNPTFTQKFLSTFGIGYSALPMVALPSILENYGPVDLLHIDIQGGEAELIPAAIDCLTEHVCYVVIGTHSHDIEQDLKATFLRNGWVIEVERAAIFSGETLSVDGVLGCRNTKLLGATRADE